MGVKYLFGLPPPVSCLKELTAGVGERHIKFLSAKGSDICIKSKISGGGGEEIYLRGK